VLRPKFLQPLAGAARTRRGWGACEFKSVSSRTPPWFASLPRQQSQGVIYPQMGSCRYSLLTLHGPVRLSPVSSPRLQVHPAKVLRGKEEPLAQEPASRTDLRTAVSWRTLNASPAPGSFPCSLTSRDPHSLATPNTKTQHAAPALLGRADGDAGATPRKVVAAAVPLPATTVHTVHTAHAYPGPTLARWRPGSGGG